MYKPHRAFLDPEDQPLVWRYLDLPRFMSLLIRHELFFCAAKTLMESDPFEGTFPRKEYDHLLTLLPSRDSVRRSHERLLKENFVSCWHLSLHESAAMWKIYAGVDIGLAVQTTIPKFKDAFRCSSRDIFIGQVQYIDYETDTYYSNEERAQPILNGFVSFIHKRKAYEHEHEYRAIVSDTDCESPTGLYVPVDLACMIQSVILAPRTPLWQLELINDILHKYLPGVRAASSDEEKLPYY